jgi:hypothetical protein
MLHNYKSGRVTITWIMIYVLPHPVLKLVSSRKVSDAWLTIYFYHLILLLQEHLFPTAGAPQAQDKSYSERFKIVFFFRCGHTQMHWGYQQACHNICCPVCGDDSARSEQD